MRGDHYVLSCFHCFEVSQASYIQDESITPRYSNYVMDRIALIRLQNYKNSEIYHSTITDFILIYSYILILCIEFGIPIVFLTLFILFQNVRFSFFSSLNND